MSDLTNKIAQAAYNREIAYIADRRRKLAHKVPANEIGAGILERDLDYKARSLGRTLTGAHKTTYGLVYVDGKGPIMRSKAVPTCKAKGAKAHKQQRVLVCDQAHTSTIDGHRRFAYITAPFRPGGAVWSKVARSKKRKFRDLLHKADRFLAAGEIAVALELSKQL